MPLKKLNQASYWPVQSEYKNDRDNQCGGVAAYRIWCAVHFSSFFRLSRAFHILTQGSQLPVAGRIARYAGCFLQPSASIFSNPTCLSSCILSMDKILPQKKTGAKAAGMMASRVKRETRQT